MRKPRSNRLFLLISSFLLRVVVFLVEVDHLFLLISFSLIRAAVSLAEEDFLFAEVGRKSGNFMKCSIQFFLKLI